MFLSWVALNLSELDYRCSRGRAVINVPGCTRTPSALEPRYSQPSSSFIIQIDRVFIQPRVLERLFSTAADNRLKNSTEPRNETPIANYSQKHLVSRSVRCYLNYKCKFNGYRKARTVNNRYLEALNIRDVNAERNVRECLYKTTYRSNGRDLWSQSIPQGNVTKGP